MKIHHEGYKLLSILLIILGVINSYFYYAFSDYKFFLWFFLVFSVGFYLFFLQFFRYPKRKLTKNPNQIIAPADGKIVVIEKTVEKEYFKDDRIQISIFMSPLNVHVNRNPISGIVKYFKYHEGKYLVAWHPKSSELNERTTVVTQRQDGLEVLFRQIAGAAARRIRWYIKPGDKVEQTEDFGFIKFGSRVDVFLPPNAKILCSIGEKSVGGITVLAEI